MPDIFLNCDLSEHQSDTQIAELMPYIHMANVSSLKLPTIEKCAQLADANKPIAVSTGASIYPTGDELSPELSLSDFRSLLEIQLIRFSSTADLNHIKLHGSLLQLVEGDEKYRVAFLEFVRNRCLISIICPIGSQLEKSAREAKLPITPEVILDAHYTTEGILVEDSGSDSSLILTRLEQLHKHGEITSEHGDPLSIPESYDHITVSLTEPANVNQLKSVREYLDAI